MGKKIIVLIIVFVLIAGMIFYLLFNKINNKEDILITNFDECVMAGNPAMESYPRKCRDPISDKTFIEEINDFWRLDNIELRQHETEGNFGCFGCSSPGKTPALCVDPIMEMKQVLETDKRYCDSEFNVIES